MNSVMDDNRLLTLPNGERIRLQPHCCMICETFDLQYASPATISRCGMVWADPKNLGYRPFFERYDLGVRLVSISRCRGVVSFRILRPIAMRRAGGSERAVRRRRGHPGRQR